MLTIGCSFPQQRSSLISEIILFFSVNSDKCLLSTFERGGDGGMIYQANQYRFVDGTLTLVESEKQERTNREGVYRKSLSRFKDGKLHLVKMELIKAPPPK
jgi:hypothetical protein